ncbi:MAG: pyruvate dehydrogenase (acetyl-transferring) E1 component subunit alpha, partial [Planifilum fulgidum]
IEMYRVSEEAVGRARRGEGPSIIEIETYRYLGHFQGDPEIYRDPEEVASLRKKDPIDRLKSLLIKEHSVSSEELEQLESRARAEVDEAYAFARSSPYPDPDEALEDVFHEVKAKV